MAKKRKAVDKIEVTQTIEQIKSDKPACFGTKCEYCAKEVCGEWFDKCEYVEFVDEVSFVDVT